MRALLRLSSTELSCEAAGGQGLCRTRSAYTLDKNVLAVIASELPSK